MAETTKRLRIYGRVQGVFYRAWSIETARGLGIGGWVRNCSDGSVEIVARGAYEAVRRLIDRCRDGPPAARVERIDVDDFEGDVPAGFAKRPTV